VFPYPMTTADAMRPAVGLYLPPTLRNQGPPGSARLASAEPSESLVHHTTRATLMDQATVKLRVRIDIHAVEAIPPVPHACSVIAAVPSNVAPLVDVA